MKLEWKYINGIQGVKDDRYLISNNGDVVSVKSGKWMTPQPSNRGYLLINIGKPCTIHRLVAIFFVPGRSATRCQVNHKDGNKLNNNSENLEWVTPSENIRHAYGTGLMKAVSGELNPHATITADEVEKICSYLLEYNGDLNSVCLRCKEEGIIASYQIIMQIKHKQSWVEVSDKWFDKNHFHVNHFSTEDVEKICQSLIKHNGYVPAVVSELKPEIPCIRYSRVNGIKYKVSHVRTSDRFFKTSLWDK